MTAHRDKPLMRCLGEFVGHIVKAITSDSQTREVDRETQEVVKGNLTLRRTTIDEIELPPEELHRD
jgi:hypothetical protein